jgi:hypothetical protein
MNLSPRQKLRDEISDFAFSELKYTGPRPSDFVVLTVHAGTGSQGE